MAKSENQGIQIALIIFAFMFILATVGFIYYISENSKNVQAAADAKKQAAEDAAAARNSADKWTAVCALMGLNPNSSLDELKTDWTATVTEATGPISQGQDPNTSVTGQQALQLLSDEVKAKNKQIADQGAQLAALEKAIDDLRTADEAKFAKLQEEFNKASEAHQQVAANVAERDQQHTNDMNRLNAELAAKDKAVQDAQTALTNAQAEFETKTTDLERQLASATQRLLDLQNESFTTPDGIIRLVDQSAETVYINLGSADNLRPQITFSVWSKDAAGLARSGQPRKGAIEIMRIDGAHSAEARITQQDPLHPIVPGDLIATPLWQPGEPLGFALVGSLDLDGDSISDRDQILQLIQANGGVLDSEFKDDGTVEGNMTVDTKYIIVGKSPAGKEEEVTKMLQTADRLGVQRISLSDFLERSGYRHSRESKAFGIGARAGDFDTLPVDNSRFRTRRPPSGVNK